MKEKNKTVFVMLSGGVDSSVTAALLKKEGYDVTGVFMRNWRDDVGQGCPWYQDEKDARIVAEKLKIPFYTFNFEDSYKKKVFQEMLDQFAAGRTPNPDVLCNSKIKFKLFLEKALKLGADFVATGHYVRLKRTKDKLILMKGIDEKKDQSYFLWQLQPWQLKYSLFPLGSLKKTDVRKIAKKLGLHTAKKPDSQGICFVGKLPFSEFIKTYLGENPGTIVDMEGKKLGGHPGLHFFTIGQRKGLKLPGGPYYVTGKKLSANTLVVAHITQEKDCCGKELVAGQANWLTEPKKVFSCQASIRYQQKPVSVKVFTEKRKIRVVFRKPQKSIAPGQSIVFYKKDVLMGGAIIEM